MRTDEEYAALEASRDELQAQLARAVQLYEAVKLDAAAELKSRQQYQQQAFELQAKLRQLQLTQPDEVITIGEDEKIHYPDEITELKAKLHSSEAVGSWLHEAIEIFFHEHGAPECATCAERLDKAMSAHETHGTAFLAQRGRMRKALEACDKFFHDEVPANVPVGFWGKYEELRQTAIRLTREALKETEL